MERSSSDTTLVEWQGRSLLPAAWEDTVRRVGVREIPEAGRSLAQSLATDPLSQYLLDGDDMVEFTDEQKWKLHVNITTYMLAGHCYKGIVTSIGPDLDALALWLPPGKDMDDWWTTIRSGTWRLYYQLTAEGRKRYYDEMLPLFRVTKARVMRERDAGCIYLVYIGTKQSARCRGYATKLIMDMAEKADAEKRPIYLESSCLKNNAYYAKFGFEVKQDIVFKRGRVPLRLYAMVREPQPHQACLLCVGDGSDCREDKA